MFRSSAKSVANATGGARTIDFFVVLIAGLFFAKIVMGNPPEQEPILAYAAEIQACGSGCTVAQSQAQ